MEPSWIMVGAVMLIPLCFVLIPVMVDGLLWLRRRAGAATGR